MRSLAVMLLGLALEPCVEPAGGGSATSSSGTEAGTTQGNLLGTWNGTLANPNGSMSQVQLALGDDTSFTQQVATAGAVTTLTGVFTVPSAGTLVLSVQSATPSDTCSGGVCMPINYPSTITHTYSFPDADSLTLVNKACSGTACKITYKRAPF